MATAMPLRHRTGRSRPLECFYSLNYYSFKVVDFDLVVKVQGERTFAREDRVRNGSLELARSFSDGKRPHQASMSPGQKRRLIEDHSAGLARSPKSVPCPPMEGAGEDSPVLCPEPKSHKSGFGDSGAGPDGSGAAGVMAATGIGSGAK